MHPHIFIFIGRSGCGKGTQADLLAAYLAKNDSARPTFRLETGWRFREFIQKDTYTAKLAREVYKKGELMPEFLSINVWAGAFIDSFKENQHVIIDGSPRQIHEAYALDSAFQFYGAVQPHIIYLRTSEKWSTDRLEARRRADDTMDDIKTRMHWFDTDVAPVLDYYRNNRDYHFIEIDGERDIQSIHKEIISETLHVNITR